MKKQSIKKQDTHTEEFLLLQVLRNELRQAGNTEIAQWQAAYMKNRFPFLGIKTPQRQAILKPYFKQITNEPDLNWRVLVQQLWDEPEREFHYCACELTEHLHKQWQTDLLPFFENLLRQNQWWDSIDTLAARVIGPFLLKFPEHLPLMDTWIEDSDFWIRRTALIFQLKYKTQTDTERLFRYCEQTAHEKEFFIRKAIGWALREYAKTNPEAVLRFVNTHPILSPLSRREALKHLS